MSKDSVENKLDILIFLLENLPSKIADEMEKRHELRKEMRINEEMEFYTSNGDEIAKFLKGFNNSQVDDNDGRVQPLEKAVKRKA